MWGWLGEVYVAHWGGDGQTFAEPGILLKGMKKRILPMGLVLCMAVVLGALSARGAEEDAKLESFFRGYLEEFLQMRPLAASRLGDHRFDHLLEDLSKESRDEWVQHARTTLRGLPREVNYRELSRDGQINFEIFRQDLRRDIWLAENTRPFEEDPRAYNGYINDSVYSLLAQSTLPLATNIANSIARMKFIPEVVAVARETIERPLQPHLDTAIRQNRGAIGFFERGLFEFTGETPLNEDLRRGAGPVVEALRQHQGFLESLTNRTSDEWRLGKRKFSQKLALVLDAGMDAEEVLADAEAEFERVRNEMYVLARQAWSEYFPDQVLPPDDGEGRRQTIALVLEKVGKEHGEPENLVADARATVDRIKRFIREQDILELPEPDRCEIIEMPEFRRGNAAAYLDSAPPLDFNTASFYAISPPPSDWNEERVRSFLEEYNRHMLQVLTIHEAYPGHYVQLEYSNRTDSLIRQVLRSGGFIEGWAVYTEQMMLDQGYGDRDLALRLSQLKFYLRAVANAILDHKMHCTRLSDEEALEFLTNEAFQSEGEARLKIIRAKQSSVQLSTYFVGRMAHYRLRQQIQRELGNRFDLSRYHEAVLSHGSVPVKFLPELVRRALGVPNG